MDTHTFIWADGEQQASGIQVLPMVEHVLAVGDLSSVHRDPFDRLIVAQANFEEADLLTADPIFKRYLAKVIW